MSLASLVCLLCCLGACVTHVSGFSRVSAVLSRLGNEIETVQKKWMYIDGFVFAFLPHCFSSLSCINEHLAIDSGGRVY